MHIPHAYIISSRRRATTSLMRWPVKQALVYRPVRWLVKHTLVYRPTLWLVSQALGSMERRPWRRRRPCHPCQSLTNSNIRRAIDRPPFIDRTHPIARVHGNEASDLSVIPCPLPLYCFFPRCVAVLGRSLLSSTFAVYFALLTDDGCSFIIPWLW